MSSSLVFNFCTSTLRNFVRVASEIIGRKRSKMSARKLTLGSPAQVVSIALLTSSRPSVLAKKQIRLSRANLLLSRQSAFIKKIDGILNFKQSGAARLFAEA